MIIFKRLTMKNFLSVGNVEQVIDLDSPGITLILGQNNDVGDSSNGSGKSSAMSAISFALFGKPLTSIKLDNLVNKINSKNMSVSLTFEKNGKTYKIERGRKPTFLKFYEEDKELNAEQNNAQGENKNTDEYIEKILGINFDLYKFLISNNTTVVPFLNLPAAGQRDIIEDLLGIKSLTLKADKLRVLLNGDRVAGVEGTKDRIIEEEYRIKSIIESNSKIEKIIEDLKQRSKNWKLSQSAKIKELSEHIEKLSHINIDEELLLHEKQSKLINISTQLTAIEKEITNITNITTLKNNWDSKQLSVIEQLNVELENLKKIDIDFELLQFENKVKLDALNKELTFINSTIQSKNKSMDKLLKLIDSNEKQLTTSEENICPTCGQQCHDDKLDTFKKELAETLEHYKQDFEKEKSEFVDLTSKKEQFEKDISAITVEKTFYKTVNDANSHVLIIDQLEKELDKETKKENPYTQQLNDVEIGIEELTVIKEELYNEVDSIGIVDTFYKTVNEAHEHKNKLDKLLNDKIRELEAENPFENQIEETLKNIQKVDDSRLTELYETRDHQQTLLKLLTDKNSFIRKKVIDQTLHFLNNRLNHYTNKLGLPHEVKFQNDLSVDINYMGSSFDPGNLSQGEFLKFSMSLAFSFRDVFESMNTHYSFWGFDENIDQNLDYVGVNAVIEHLKHEARTKNRSIFIVSHRDELKSRIDKKLIARKENGFTEYLYDEYDE